MKKLFFPLFLFLVFSAKSQTAANWSANDCSGNNHELFKDLDGGKVVAIIWVMPCATCINETHFLQTEVQNALAAHPGKILFYLADDYANTNCSTLSGWCAANGITDATIFSTAAIKMDPYGEHGMPKIVIVSGTDHKVFYNQNAPAINSEGIKNALTAALAHAPTDIGEQSSKTLSVTIAPNPSDNSLKLNFGSPLHSPVRIEISDQSGKLLQVHGSGLSSIHGEEITINTAGLPPGVYFLNISSGDKKVYSKLIVNR